MIGAIDSIRSFFFEAFVKDRVQKKPSKIVPKMIISRLINSRLIKVQSKFHTGFGDGERWRTASIW